MFSYVLVPVDGSPESEAVLPFAASVSGRMGVELRLLQVMGGHYDRCPVLR